MSWMTQGLFKKKKKSVSKCNIRLCTRKRERSRLDKKKKSILMSLIFKLNVRKGHRPVCLSACLPPSLSVFASFSTCLSPLCWISISSPSLLVCLMLLIYPSSYLTANSPVHCFPSEALSCLPTSYFDTFHILHGQDFPTCWKRCFKKCWVYPPECGNQEKNLSLLLYTSDVHNHPHAWFSCIDFLCRVKMSHSFCALSITIKAQVNVLRNSQCCFCRA